MDKTLEKIIKMAGPISPQETDHSTAIEVADCLLLHMGETGASLTCYRGFEVNNTLIDLSEFKEFIKSYAAASGLELEPKVVTLAKDYIWRLAPPQTFRNLDELTTSIKEKKIRLELKATTKKKMNEIFNAHFKTKSTNETN